MILPSLTGDKAGVLIIDKLPYPGNSSHTAGFPHMMFPAAGGLRGQVAPADKGVDDAPKTSRLPMF
jgi:hypothetical protein